MTPEELRNHIRQLADSKCRIKHPDYYSDRNDDSEPVNCGPSGPCESCVEETDREYTMKRAKAHGRELSPEEAAEWRKRLGLE